MGKRIVFVADSHLPRSDEAVAEFLRYLGSRALPADGLYLLGDIFHYAVGLASFRTEALDRLIDFLSDLAGKGVAVGYVAGNRDFFLDEMLRGISGIAYTDDVLDIAPFGIPIHLAHGDTINARDRQYLLWRRFIRSRPLRAALQRTPKSIALGLGDRIERRMRATNRRYRVSFPETECRAYGEAAVRRGARLVLLGHFHDPLTLPLHTPEGDGALHVVPDWMGRRTHSELYEDGTFRLEAARP